MNSKEAGERFKVLNAYNNSQEIRHLSLKQEKKLFAERKIR
ncbi:MAG: hypothetical protein PF569_03945 [Candidatus Woesearchaeota archaeon]|jgi:hypothetical protein|nr:hypothetical protein [Candidatus Woesearchaeota archaeon]